MASVPDREHTVAEIWCGGDQIAELRREQEEVIVEFYARPGLRALEFRYEDLMNLLPRAKQRLLGDTK